MTTDRNSEAVDCLPCPFCGSGQDNARERPFPMPDGMGGTYWIARCGNPNCAAEVEDDTAEAATARWNRRTTTPATIPVADVQALVEDWNTRGAIGEVYALELAALIPRNPE